MEHKAEHNNCRMRLPGPDLEALRFGGHSDKSCGVCGPHNKEPPRDAVTADSR